MIRKVANIMKIQGPNPYINTYKNIKQPPVKKQPTNQKDQLNISTEAKQMQETKHHEMKRAEYVKDIKQSVQSGEYKVEHEKLAQKMIDFWSKDQ